MNLVASQLLAETEDTMRECNTCHISKPLTDYNRAPHLKEGRQYKCRACVREWGIYYRKTQDPVKVRTEKAAYRLTHRAVFRAGEIRYYNKHKDRHMACTANRIKVRRRADPVFRQKLMDRCRTHYLKRYGCEVGLAALFDSQLGRCANPVCGKSLKETCELDHIMPVALGGTNDLQNLQFLCMNCNRRKNRKHPDVWLTEEKNRVGLSLDCPRCP